MTKNSRKRRSTTSSKQPPSPSSSFSSTTQHQPPTRRSSSSANSSSNLSHTLLAFLLALISFTRSSGKWTIIPIFLLTLVILAILYLLGIYLLLPLLYYPLVPVKWTFRRFFGVAKWGVAWVVWAVKGTAWIAFYVHFSKMFFFSILERIEDYVKFIDEEERKRAQQQSNEHGHSHTRMNSHSNGPFTMQEEDDHDYSDMPPLEKPEPIRPSRKGSGAKTDFGPESID